LALPQGNTIFRSTSVKPYLIDTSDTADKSILVDDTEPEFYTEYKSSIYKSSTYKPPTEHES
jgi:hypothetical protein